MINIAERELPTRTDEELSNDGYAYFIRSEKGEELYRYYRRDPSGEVRVVLNPNEWIDREDAGDGVAVGRVVSSADHRYVAYCADVVGGGCEFTMYVKHATSDDVLFSVRGVDAMEWSDVDDGTYALYCTKRDESVRELGASKVVRIEFDATNGRTNETMLVDMSHDRKRFADVRRTKDGAYVIVNFMSKTSSTMFALSTRHVDSPLLPLWDEDAHCFAEHNDGYFYLLTSDDDETGEMCVRRVSCDDLVRHATTETSSASPSSLETIVPARSWCPIEDMDMFRSHLVLYERERDGVPDVRVFSIDGHRERRVDIPMFRHREDPRHITPAPNALFDAASVRFVCSSPTMPPVRCAYDFATNTTTAMDDVNESYKTEFACYRDVALSSDGVEVPITVTHGRHLALDGSSPALLLGYGAYGTPLDVSFCPARLSLLRRGWVVAMAHVRGGGELGTSWHDDGRLFNKHNSFRDFVACAEWLIRRGYTSNESLGAMASSAGGLLLGVAANERPDLFRAMVLDAPFLDVAAEMSDATLPLTEHEYDEWGDARDPRVADYIRRWDPIENVTSQAYPAMLVTTSLDDDHVGWTNAANWVDRVRRTSTSDEPILLRASSHGGHFGSSGRYERYEDISFSYSFLLHHCRRQR